MNITQHFVSNQNIPEFIKIDHEMFDTFIKAYYEWLELNNDSENTNYFDVYKAVGNPGWLVNNQEKVVDIDKTIDEFIEYFAKEVCPIAIDNIQTNPKFFLKKIRDIYLAKGTPNSFKLFFKLYYNDNIDVFETGDTILRASDGKYFAFPTAHFYVTDYEDQLDKIDFTLGELLNDSEKFVVTILNGELVGETKQGESIVKTQFADDITLEPGSYYIKSSDKLYQVKVNTMVSLSELNLSKTGALYNENDPVYVDSIDLERRFYGSVSSVDSGTVEGIKVRDRGVYYTPSDYFQFTDGNKLGGQFTITDTGKYGDVKKIDNIPVRTGASNNGFEGTNLEDVFIGIRQGGSFDNLPVLSYNNVNSYTDVGTGNPYQKATAGGVGLQITPISTSIGTARSVVMNQETFFKDSDDVLINVPATVIIENNTLQKGDKVSFQKFANLANYGPLTDDSEEITFTYDFIHIYETGVPDGYKALDSEISSVDNITFVYDFDSETFDWKYKTVNIVKKFDETGAYVVKPLKDILDSESKISYDIEEIYANVSVIDGGGFTVNADSEYDFGSDDSEFISNAIEKLDGGDFLTFAGAKISRIKIKFKGKSISQLEDYHFAQLDNLVGMDSELFAFSYETTKGEPRLPNNDSDVGVWVDLGYTGEVISIDRNNQVAKIISYGGSVLPTQKDLDLNSADKYSIIKVSPIVNNESVKDYSLPLTNVVHQIQRIEIDYKTSVVSSLFSKFYNQDGFISSDFGGTIQDNYYYSDYSYRIKSQLPLQDWKEKVKTMLHPAGFIMTADYVQNLEGQAADGTVDLFNSDNFKTHLTFDMQQEYIDLHSLGQGITTDGIHYKANAFESVSILDNTASSLLSSNATAIKDILYKQQSGNAWWDYEPIGHVRNIIDSDIITLNRNVFDNYLNLDSEVFRNKYTTQTADVNGNVDNTYKYFQFFDGSRQDGYKNQSRVPKKYSKAIAISKVQFEEAGLVEYKVYDSELPNNFVVNWSDSEDTFRSIDYRRILNDSDERYYPLYKIQRTWDIAMFKERDLNLAMREDGSLVFDDSDKIYYDFEAYERKWNEINNRRTRNNEGWSIKGYNQSIAFEDIGQRSKKRNKNWSGSKKEYVLKNAPFHVDALKGNTFNWQRHYYPNGVINNTHIDYDYENESYKDPAISMRNRRSGR